MSEELILRCEDSLEGIFTAIYDAFVYKNRMAKPYTDSISIAVGEGGSLSLFARELSVVTDADKVYKTVHAIQTRLGLSVYDRLLASLCHFADDRATAVLGYLVRGFAKGRRVSEEFADPYVMRIVELSRKVYNEREKFYGFLRFRLVPGSVPAQQDAGEASGSVPVQRLREAVRGVSEQRLREAPGSVSEQGQRETAGGVSERELYEASKKGSGGVLWAQIEPKCNLVPIMTEHFADRFPGEHFIICDSKRKLAAVHEAYHSCVLVSGLEPAVERGGEDYMEVLWKRYFDTMEIRERHNERCQRTLMPHWYRKHMTELT